MTGLNQISKQHCNIINKMMMVICILVSLVASGQERSASYDEVKDLIVSKYNKGDYSGIYGMMDTAFSNSISETKLVNFLKGNENSGKILQSSFQSMEKGTASYLLNCQLRDMVLRLQVTPDKKISSFGLGNAPQVLLDKAPAVKSNNPLKSATDRAIDSAAKEYFRNPKAAALTIGIIKNGQQQIYHYGAVDQQNDQLPNDQTLYEIGSITKTFTATLLAQAVMEGKVSLDDDIRKYLKGEWNNLGYNSTPITFRNLANHTSGLPGLPDDIGEQPAYDPVNPEANYDAVLFYKALHHFSPDTVPGFKFLYSNWGMALLGHLLENIYEQPYPELLKKYVTNVLGMQQTQISNGKQDNNFAFPHSENGNKIAIVNEGYFEAAGGILSNSHDLLLYLQAQLNETNPAIKLTHQPGANSMGLGWGVRTVNGQREFQHNGSTQGSTAHISAFPDIDSGCIILTNNKVNMGSMILAVQNILKRS